MDNENKDTSLDSRLDKLGDAGQELRNHIKSELARLEYKPKFPMSTEAFTAHMEKLKEKLQQEHAEKEAQTKADKEKIRAELQEKEEKFRKEQEEIKLLTRGCRGLYRSL
jgi:hypothetical protein